MSSGELGHLTAHYAQKAGARVTILEGPLTKHYDSPNAKMIKFKYYNELLKLLRQEAKKNYDYIIHAAAVSDYQPKHKVQLKISSARKKLTLDFKPTIKIINRIKRWAPHSTLVGFKLEPTLTRKNAKSFAHKLIEKAGCEIVVANKTRPYRAYILDENYDIKSSSASRKELAQKLIKLLPAYS